MCEYSELRISEPRPIMRSMQAEQLKSLVESGHYKPDPSQVAAAMLRRRGVRELLSFGSQGLGGTGRIPGSSAGTPRTV
jgi:hypothetical protein